MTENIIINNISNYTIEFSGDKMILKPKEEICFKPGGCYKFPDSKNPNDGTYFKVCDEREHGNLSFIFPEKFENYECFYLKTILTKNNKEYFTWWDGVKKELVEVYPEVYHP